MLFVYSILNKLRIIIRKPRYKKMTQIIPGAEPFFYKRGKTGILLIHGFTSSAYDGKYLGQYLADRNISVNAILLKGHGTCPENMTATNLKDWIKSAENGLKELKKHCTKVIVGGDSFGGNLALMLAAKHDVDGVISMGTPIYNKKKIIAKIYFIVNYFIFNYKKKWYHKELDREIIKHRITYPVVPLSKLLDLVKGIKLCKRLLPKVVAPVLIMQSTADFGVDEKSVGYIFRNVNSKKRKIYWVKDAYHVFIIDHDRERSFKVICDFIQSI